MNLRYLLLTLLICSIQICHAQDQPKYAKFVQEAWTLYEAKDYSQAAEKYKEAFDQLNGKAYPSDRYNAACSYALADDPENAFYHLFYLAENPKIKYNKLEMIMADQDLLALHKNKRWSALIQLVKANKEEYEKDLNKPLVALLDTIHQDDQQYRAQIDEYEKKYGWQSEEMQILWNTIHLKDSINLIKVTKILEEFGWLGPQVVGNRGNSTLFLVIQHANLEVQQKYLPMMREAVTLGNAQASSLALLEDRVALRLGKRQIYGSQIMRDEETEEYYVSPLIDPENVNKRRAEVGLGPIEEYITNWGMTWDLEKHKERTKMLEEKSNE